MTSVGGFIGIPPLVPTPPVWTADSACIDCGFYEQARKNRMDQISFWDQGLVLSGTFTPGKGMQCTNCSLLSSAAKTFPAALTELHVGPDTYWSGIRGAAEKQAYVAAGGSASALPDDASGSGTPVPEPEPSNPDAAPATDGDGSSSSSAQLLGMKQQYGILVLAAIGAGVLLLVVGVAVALRRRAARNNKDMLNRMGGDRGMSMQLSPNPVAASPSVRSSSDFQQL